MRLKILFLLSLPVLFSGCDTVRDCSLTYRVWHAVPVAKCRPATSPQLQVFQKSGAKPDVLIVYDEFVERKSTIRRRAFFVSANEQRLNRGRKPAFANLDDALGLEPLPVQLSEPTVNPSSKQVSKLPAELSAAATDLSGGLWAKSSTDGSALMLGVDGKELNEYTLPVYSDRVQRVRRVLLTPLAVAGDVTLLGVAVGLASGIGFLYSGGSYSL